MVARSFLSLDDNKKSEMDMNERIIVVFETSLETIKMAPGGMATLQLMRCRCTGY